VAVAKSGLFHENRLQSRCVPAIAQTIAQPFSSIAR
jgi:hypothetical protein